MRQSQKNGTPAAEIGLLTEREVSSVYVDSEREGAGGVVKGAQGLPKLDLIFPGAHFFSRAAPAGDHCKMTKRAN